MIPPVSVCHQLSWTGQPERLLAPDDHLGVERLADAGDEPQRCAGRGRAARLGPGPHQHAQRGRRRVPDADPLVLEDAVPALGVEVGLVDDARHAVGERGDDPVGRAGHPAGIGGAPEDVVGVEVERGAAGGVVGDDRVVDVDGALRACPSCRS